MLTSVAAAAFLRFAAPVHSPSSGSCGAIDSFVASSSSLPFPQPARSSRRFPTTEREKGAALKQTRKGKNNEEGERSSVEVSEEGKGEGRQRAQNLFGSGFFTLNARRTRTTA